MKREPLSVIGIGGLFASFLTLISFVFFLFHQNTFKKCLSFFKACTITIFSSSYLLPTLLFLLGVGILFSFIKIIALLKWSTKGAGKKLHPKLINAITEALKYQPRIKEIPVKLLNEKSIAACIAGWRKPFILINPELVEKLEVSEITALLLHEYAHIKGKDHTLSYLSSILKSILFFFPMAYFFHFLFLKGRERSADHAASNWMGTPLPLAQALLKTARLKSCHPGPLTSFWEKPSSLKERIENLLNEKAPFPLKNLVISFILTLLLLIFTLSPTLASEKRKNCQSNQCIKNLPCCQSFNQK
jgi:beta-lactamase regulating signal transducer with metallopeptidase domain